MLFRLCLYTCFARFYHEPSHSVCLARCLCFSLARRLCCSARLWNYFCFQSFQPSGFACCSRQLNFSLALRLCSSAQTSPKFMFYHMLGKDTAILQIRLTLSGFGRKCSCLVDVQASSVSVQEWPIHVQYPAASPLDWHPSQLPQLLVTCILAFTSDS